MDRTEMIERLEEIAKHAVHTLGEEPFFMSLDDGIAVKEAIEIISAQPTQTNTPNALKSLDCIDRQAAIDALNKLDVSDGVGISSIACDLQEEAIRSIKSLPSAQPDLSEYSDKLWQKAYEQGKAAAQPERIRGRWTDKDGGLATCSACGDRWGVWSVMNFCPNCGADMREKQDE